MRWLKNWIRGICVDENGNPDLNQAETVDNDRENVKEPATEEEVAAFLKAVTGSPALPRNVQIRIQEIDSASAYPSYHTCSRSMDMPIGANCRRHPTQRDFFYYLRSSVLNAQGHTNG